MIEENIFYNYMNEVFLKGGGKKIIDIDHVIFFYMKNKKDLEYLNLDSKSKTKFIKIGFPSMYVDLKSSTYGDEFDLIFPVPKGKVKDMMDNIIEDYKKGKISKDVNSKILNDFGKIYITSQLKNGIFKGTDIKINLLKNTRLYFVNALAHTEKDIKKFFDIFDKKINYNSKSKIIQF